MNAMDSKIGHHTVILARLEPVSESHEAQIAALNQITKEVHSNQILENKKAIDILKSQKLDILQHEEDAYKLKTMLLDSVDQAAHYKNHF